jgi:fructokinase
MMADIAPRGARPYDGAGIQRGTHRVLRRGAEPIGDEKSGWDRAATSPTPDVATVRRLLAPWPHATQIIGVGRLDGGFQNRNIALTLDGPPRRAVLRLYDSDAAACVKEAALLARLRKQGPEVPVPRVFYAQTDGAGDWPPHAVLEYIDGVALRELAVAGDRRAVIEAARDVGRVLARIASIASIAFAEPGFLRGDLAVDPTFGGYPASYRSLVARLMDSPNFRDRVTAPVIAAIESFVDRWAERVDAPAASTLVHGDFNSRNILVRDVDGRWRVAAVLDWEFAISGSYLSDAGNLLRYERAGRRRFEPAFSEGMHEGGLALAADWLAHARALDLIALVEMVGRRDLATNVVQEILALIDRTVAPKA